MFHMKHLQKTGKMFHVKHLPERIALYQQQTVARAERQAERAVLRQKLL